MTKSPLPSRLGVRIVRVGLGVDLNLATLRVSRAVALEVDRLADSLGHLLHPLADRSMVDPLPFGYLLHSAFVIATSLRL
jgi:hypothetical protein